MKLVGKITLAIVLATCGILGIYGYLAVRREQALFESDMRRDEHMLGNALRVVLEDVWSREGEGQALRLIQQADDRAEVLRIRFTWLDAPPGHTHRTSVPPSELTELARGAEVVRLERASDRRLYTYVPVQVSAPRVGALELSESLDEEERYTRESAVNTALTLLIFVLMSGAVAMAVGAYFVGRPVQRLIEKARRIGAGDFDGPLLLNQRDELGDLAAEINHMCDRLAEAHASLARETAARLQAIDQLRHADRLTTVGTLASGIAHELGTPLNVAGGRAKMLLQSAPEGETRAYAQIIVEQVDRMATIIRQLLDFARRRRGQKAPANIALLVGQTLSLLTPLAKKSGVTLTLCTESESAPTPIQANVDAGQLQQALTNLVVNGVQAMPRGGEVTVRVRRVRAKPPTEHGGSEGEYIAVCVHDQGGGIADDDLSRIFEPFFTTKEIGEGTGLGLSVAYGIVREHDGWIEVKSEPGTGSTFTLYLPDGSGAGASAAA